MTINEESRIRKETPISQVKRVVVWSILFPTRSWHLGQLFSVVSEEETGGEGVHNRVSTG